MKKKPDRLMRWILFATLALMILLALGWLLSRPVDINKLDKLNQSSVVMDKNGNPFALVGGVERRTNVYLVNVPGDVQNAFIAAEDARFYDHFGIDPYRMGGALLANVKRQSYAQGASTITQQLIKLTHLTSDKTMVRKLTEIAMAIKLERILSKAQILERYLNTVYFGAGAYGIQSAAYTYFGTDANKLSLEQGALLAAIIKSPTHYAPHIHPEDALRRRNRILRDMETYQFISPDQAESAIAQPLGVKHIEEAAFAHPWAVDEATREASDRLGISLDELISGGYQIYTSLDDAVQSAAESLFADASSFPGDAQAALVALDPKTGGILALIGGREYLVQRGLNRATQIARQPGSTIKPLSVYAAAIDQYHYLPSSIIDDTQRDFGGGYSPRNANDQYRGTVTLRESLARSLNAASVDLMTRVGIPAAVRYAKAAGVPIADTDSNLSLALGSMTYGLSPAQLCAAYAPLSNGGTSVRAHLVEKIVSADGELVYQYRPKPTRVMSAQSAYLITGMLQSAVAFGSAQKLSNLSADVAAKTGTVAMEGGGNRDIWTTAYTPRAVVTVWMGHDEPSAARKLPDSAGGSNQPAALCAQLLSDTRSITASGRFVRPSGLTEVLIDQRALQLHQIPMLATQYTPKSMTIREVFPDAKVPTEPSNAWIPPLRPFDLSGELRTPSTASLSFTILQEDVLYRLYRAEDSPVFIAEVRGTAGERISVGDDQAYEGAAYYVIPLHAELFREGITLEGKPSETFVPKRPFGFRDWIALPSAPPEEESAKIPEEVPLFSLGLASHAHLGV